MNLNTTNLFALATAVSDKVCKAERPNLMPGEYEIDTTINIKGTMTVGEDYDVAPTVSIPLIETVALLLKRMGFQRDGAITIIREVFSEAIALNGRGKGALLKEMPELAAAITMVREEIISKLDRQDRKGVIKSNFTIEELTPAMAE